MAFGVSSCNDKYGDDLRGIGRRVEILEDSLLSQNISIENIKKILDVIDKNGYVKAVIKNPNGSYTIQFSNGTSVVLHDGKDGKDGRDASADEFYVSVAKGEDGAWYWTVNGEFIIGEDGNPMRASAIDGKDGKDGKDDIDLSLIIPTSRINPVTRIWEISTDGGITYVSTGILADGRDGISTQTNLGVAKGEDGVWYWTFNGTWILDESGNRLRANGIDGKDGKDDINLSLPIPITRINSVTRIWEISLDNGVTFTSTGINADGKDGKDGISAEVNMGVAKGEDGKWYWTINGTWLLDSQGNRVPTTGQDGKDGKDDINLSLPVPITRINSVTRIWEISTDGGITYVSTGIKADGTDGKDGATAEVNLKIAKGEDGVWYWTFNNKWVLDESGNRVRAVGLNGKDGKDDIDMTLPVPIARINALTREWEISTDNGITYFNTGVVADGKDGRDGIAAEINLGIAKGEDGVWYWTYNNTWLIDKNGNRVRAVGYDGKDGKDGKDDINLTLSVPRVRINAITREWEISTNNGASYVSTGIYADGIDGVDGYNGKDGKDDRFISVTFTTIADQNYALLLLRDGGQLIVPVVSSGN